MINLVIGIIIGAIFAFFVCDYKKNKMLDIYLKKIKKLEMQFHTAIHWKECADNLKIVKWCECKGYQNVSIYGFGYLGKSLFKDLIHSDIKIECIIDNSLTEKVIDSVTCISSQNVKSTQCIIVTVIDQFDNIYSELKGKVDCEIVCIDDVIFEDITSL